MSRVLWCFRCQREPDEDCEYCRFFTDNTYVTYVDDGDEESEEEVRPMQVELEGDGYADGELVYDYGKCPKCGWEFEEGDKDWIEPYCCHCGQRLKWFEESEEEE